MENMTTGILLRRDRQIEELREDLHQAKNQMAVLRDALEWIIAQDCPDDDSIGRAIRAFVKFAQSAITKAGVNP